MAGALTRDEARALLEHAKRIRRGFSGARDAAMYGLMYRCGLRSAEVTSLDLDDLEQADSGVWRITVRHPKGWRRGAPPRTIGVDPGMLEILGDWLRHRGDEPGPLFVTRTGARVDTSHLRRKIKQAAKGAGIRKRVHCHGMRHTFAVQLDEEGVSMKTIQGSLGHRSLATTGIYLARHSSHRVVETTGRREW